VEDIEWYADTFKALKIFESLGYELFVVTNQSGVGRGYFSLESVYVIHRQLQNDLRAHKLDVFKDFGICPHAPAENCQCRKPSGQMIKDLMEKYHINSKQSYMVGDKLIDAESGENAQIQGVIVRNKPAKETHFPYFKTLLEFAQTLK